MITAEEFLKEKDDYGNLSIYADEMAIVMIKFAKLHVEAALKEASENLTMKQRSDIHELDMNDDWMEVDKNSILNAYPLENIK